MSTKKSFDKKNLGQALKATESRSSRTKLTRAKRSSVKGPEWWFDQLVDYYEEDSRASVNSLTEWCRGNGRLSPEEQASSQRTLERWASKHQWQERKKVALQERARAARDEINRTYLSHQIKRYEDRLRISNGLDRLLLLYSHVEEAQDPDGSFAEVTDHSDPRPRRYRLRTPEEYGGRGATYNLADLERLVKMASSARASLADVLPPGVGEPEPEEGDDRLVLTIASRDQIAELGARFGRLVTELRETTKRRQIERGLDDFGEPIKKPDLDAPGRDMLELDEEQGPIDDDDGWEWIEVDDPGTLPKGMRMNEAGEILPVNMPPEDGEWESGVD
jgi:hypothetical protein